MYDGNVVIILIVFSSMFGKWSKFPSSMERLIQVCGQEDVRYNRVNDSSGANEETWMRDENIFQNTFK